MPASQNSLIQLKEGGRVHLRPLKYKKVHGVGNFHNGHPLSLSNSFVSIAVHEGPDIEDDDWPVKLNAVNSLGFFVGLGVRNVSCTLFLIGVSGMSRESTF